LKQLDLIGLMPDRRYYSVKMPIFSTDKLPGVDPMIGPEMQSTGEILAIDDMFEAAIDKGLYWKEGMPRYLGTDSEIFCDIDPDDFAVFEKVLSSLKERRIAFVTDCLKTAEKLGIKYVNGYETWLKSGMGSMLISFPKKGHQNGKEKRLSAQKYRLHVITDPAQLHLILTGEGSNGREQTKSISEWLKQGERSLAKQ
jgi:carbamoyl-phosphate synthase large subunit